MNYESVVRDYERGEITAPPTGSVYFYYRGHRDGSIDLWDL